MRKTERRPPLAESSYIQSFKQTNADLPARPQASSGVESSAGSSNAVSIKLEDTCCCGVCHKDLNHLSLERRQIHINSCCDSTEIITTPGRSDSFWACPICGKVYKSEQLVRAHAKKCGKTFDVPTGQLVDLLRSLKPTQCESPISLVASRPTALRRHAQRGLARHSRTRGGKSDPDLQMALALSASLVQMKPRSKLQAKLKEVTIIPSVLATDSAEVRARVALRASEMVLNQNSEMELTCTQPLAPSLLAPSLILPSSPKEQASHYDPSSQTGCSHSDQRWSASRTAVSVNMNPCKDGSTRSVTQRTAKLWTMSGSCGYNDGTETSDFFVKDILDPPPTLATQVMDLSEPGCKDSTFGDRCVSGPTKLADDVSPKEVVYLKAKGYHAPDLDTLVGSRSHHDSSVLVQDGLVPVHLALLMCRSPSLYHEVSTAEGMCLMLENVAESDILATLRFIYTGETSISPDAIPSVRGLAQRFGLTDLLSLLNEFTTKFPSCSSRLPNLNHSNLGRTPWFNYSTGTSTSFVIEAGGVQPGYPSLLPPPGVFKILPALSRSNSPCQESFTPIPGPQFMKSSQTKVNSDCDGSVSSTKDIFHNQDINSDGFPCFQDFRSVQSSHITPERKEVQLLADESAKTLYDAIPCHNAVKKDSTAFEVPPFVFPFFEKRGPGGISLNGSSVGLKSWQGCDSSQEDEGAVISFWGTSVCSNCSFGDDGNGCSEATCTPLESHPTPITGPCCGADDTAGILSNTAVACTSPLKTLHDLGLSIATTSSLPIDSSAGSTGLTHTEVSYMETMSVVCNSCSSELVHQTPPTELPTDTEPLLGLPRSEYQAVVTKTDLAFTEDLMFPVEAIDDVWEDNLSFLTPSLASDGARRGFSSSSVCSPFQTVYEGHPPSISTASVCIRTPCDMNDCSIIEILSPGPLIGDSNHTDVSDFHQRKGATCTNHLRKSCNPSGSFLSNLTTGKLVEGSTVHSGSVPVGTEHSYQEKSAIGPHRSTKIEAPPSRSSQTVRRDFFRNPQCGWILNGSSAVPDQVGALTSQPGPLCSSTVFASNLNHDCCEEQDCPAGHLETTSTPANHVAAVRASGQCSPKIPPVTEQGVTPELPYDQLATPELKLQVRKYGVRPMKRKRMITILKEIYAYTHKNKSASAGGGGGGGSSLSSTQPSGLPPRAADGSASRKPHSLTSQPARSAVLRSHPPRDEESVFEVIEDIGSNQNLNPESADLAIKNFITSNQQLLAEVLCYKPLILPDLYRQLRAAGVHCSKTSLQDFLDSQGICFSLAQDGLAGRFKKRKRAKLLKHSGPKTGPDV